MTDTTSGKTSEPTRGSLEGIRVYIVWLLRTKQYERAEATLQLLRQGPDLLEWEQYANDLLENLGLLLRGSIYFEEAREGLRKAYLRSLALRNNNKAHEPSYILDLRYWLMIADCVAFKFAPGDHASNLAKEIFGRKTSRTGKDPNNKRQWVARVVWLILVPDLRYLFGRLVLHFYRLK